MKKLLIALLLAALLCLPAMAETLGQALPDFTVATIDGGSFTLSEALKDHDMVLINLWATWCPPCEMEFPYMELAYEQYSDRVAVLGLSVEPNDTPEKLQAYVDSHGLTFPVGSDTEVNLADVFQIETIPTSIVVDRFGNVAVVESGAQTSTRSFTALFDYFLDPEYTETKALDAFPKPKPTTVTAEALSAAGNAEGGTLAFRAPEDGVIFPMLPADIDGRTALASSNDGVDDSVSQASVEVTANEGDVLAFDFRTSVEAGYDMLSISIDGMEVKCFSGEHAWTSWALALEPGAHEVTFSYAKDAFSAEGEDKVWISNVRIASGDEAAALLAAVPVYPVGDALGAVVTNPDAQRITFDDPDGYYTGMAGWVLNDDTAHIQVTLTANDDPDRAIVSVDGKPDLLFEHLTGDGSGYAMDIPVDASGCSVIVLAASANADDISQSPVMLVFVSEDAANAYFQYSGVTWQYAE